MRAILLFIIVGVSFVWGNWGYYVSSREEMSNIIERLVFRECRGDKNAYNHNEHSAGEMQITGPALVEYNLWHGTWLTLSDLLTPATNRMVGSWYLTNYILRYRTKNNIVQAIAAYNAGLTAVINGWYPKEYLEEIIPWYWHIYMIDKKQIDRKVISINHTLIRIVFTNGTIPKIGD